MLPDTVHQCSQCLCDCRFQSLAFFSSYLFFYLIPDYYAISLPLGQSLITKNGTMHAVKNKINQAATPQMSCILA
jgi:hypothetical protein